MKITPLLIAIVLALFTLPAQATGSWMEETMYSSGKIYVVVAVVVVILLGIFGYLVWMDKRLRKMEEENAPHDENHLK